MPKLSYLLNYQLPPALQWIILAGLMALPLAFTASQYQAGQGFTALIFFGSNFQLTTGSRLAEVPHSIYPGPGYDGQFYAQLALDPLLQDPTTARALDNPSYRARRIFIPILAFMTGFGQPAPVIQAYALINLVFFAALLLGIQFFLRPQTIQHFLIAAAIAWTGGALASVSRALVDLPASVLLLYACFLPANLASISLAAAILARETSVVSLLSVVWFSSSERADNRRLALRAALILFPMAAWLLYLARVMPFGSPAGTNNFSLPFIAWAQHLLSSLSALVQERQPIALGEVTASLSFAAQACYLIVFPRKESAFWRMGIGFAILYFCLGSSALVQQLAYGRVVLPLTIAFNLLLWQKDTRHFLTWFVVGNAGVVLGFLISFLF